MEGKIHINVTNECESKEDLQAHKTGHLPPNDMIYPDATKWSEINQQEQNQYDWVRPCKHMKIHTGEKTFQCSQCDKAWSKQSDLKTHLRTHSGKSHISVANVIKYFQKAVIF